MKKETARKEYLKLKVHGYSHEECRIILEELYGFLAATRTLKRWWKRFNLGDWNLRDSSQRPHTVHYKFSAEDAQRGH